MPFTGQSTRTRSEGDQADSGGANVHQHHDDAGKRGPTGTPAPGRRAADHIRVLVLSRGRDDAGDGDAASAGGGAKDDHTARQAVLYYEKHRGRRAKAMEDLHPGFDVLSIDDNTDRQRRIEVKGTQGLFKEDASVVLTARQAEDAVQNEENGVEYWLYVVDSTETGPAPGVSHPVGARPHPPAIWFPRVRVGRRGGTPCRGDRGRPERSVAGCAGPAGPGRLGVKTAIARTAVLDAHRWSGGVATEERAQHEWKQAR